MSINERPMMDVHLVQSEISRALGLPIKITISTNRRLMICAEWEDGKLHIRLHKVFLFADEKFIPELASFCKKPSRATRALITRFINQHNELIVQLSKDHRRGQTIETAGEHHDLRFFFDKINAKHFKRACDAQITWGKASGQRKRQVVQLGSYDMETNIIRMHRVLDQKWVPAFVMEMLIYHEMLHWLFRPRRMGARRVLHSRAFLDAEKAHPNNLRTQAWIEKNIQKLLKT